MFLKVCLAFLFHFFFRSWSTPQPHWHRRVTAVVAKSLWRWNIFLMTMLTNFCWRASNIFYSFWQLVDFVAGCHWNLRRAQRSLPPKRWSNGCVAAWVRRWLYLQVRWAGWIGCFWKTSFQSRWRRGGWRILLSRGVVLINWGSRQNWLLSCHHFKCRHFQWNHFPCHHFQWNHLQSDRFSHLISPRKHKHSSRVFQPSGWDELPDLSTLRTDQRRWDER